MCPSLRGSVYLRCHPGGQSSGRAVGITLEPGRDGADRAWCRLGRRQGARHALPDIEEYKIDNDIEGPNGVVLVGPGNWPKIADRRLHRALLDHPELYMPICAVAAKLVSRIHLDPADREIFIPVTLLVHGVDMDLRDHGRCAQDLVAALSRDPANDLIRINARDFCANGDENHHRPQAECAVLVEGVHEKQ